MINETHIIGNVGKDPVMRYTPDGKPVTNFSVAVTTKYGEKEKTVWFSVTCWNKLAEIANSLLAKGKQCYVRGRVDVETFTGQDGIVRATLKLQADQIRVLGRKDDYAQAGAPAASTEELPPDSDYGEF